MTRSPVPYLLGLCPFRERLRPARPRAPSPEYPSPLGRMWPPRVLLPRPARGRVLITLYPFSLGLLTISAVATDRINPPITMLR